MSQHHDQPTEAVHLGQSSHQGDGDGGPHPNTIIGTEVVAGHEHGASSPGRTSAEMPEAFYPTVLAPGHLESQASWSYHTFGPGLRTKGLIDHITKELREIEKEPEDLSEWMDIVILGLDGAWRTGASPEKILVAFHKKMHKNYERVWPDWRQFSENEAIEHDRTFD